MIYLDSSALVKLVLPEAESDALLAFLTIAPASASSVVAAVEVPRAARRVSEDPTVLERAERVISSIDLIVLGSEVRALAARLEPTGLRSLDAIHLASAIAMDDHFDSFIAYDERLCEAAARAGLDVSSPA